MNKQELKDMIDDLPSEPSGDDVVNCVENIVNARFKTKEISSTDEFSIKTDIFNKGIITKTEYEKLSRGILKEIKKYIEEEKERTDNIDGIKHEDIRAKAEDILENGNPLEFIKKTAHQFHSGDDDILTRLICSVACQSILNTKGLQLKLSGSSGKGKSHCCTAIGHLMPKSYFMETNLSAKALFYMDELESGTTIFCDDFINNEELIGIIKRAMTKYQGESSLDTVIHGKSVKLTIPSRINWWLTSVDDDQGIELLNRQLQTDVDASSEQDDKVNKQQIDADVTGEIPMFENDDVLICREIFTIIKEQPEMIVKIEFANRFIWKDKSNRQNYLYFSDFIKSFAVLNYRQRKKDDDGKIIADIEDYNEAKKVYVSRARHQKYKLNDSEFKILETIEKHGVFVQRDSGEYEISAPFLQKKLRISEGGLRFKMNGRPNQPESGLCNKYNGVKSEPRREGKTTRTYYILTRNDYGSEEEVVSLKDE